MSFKEGDILIHNNKPLIILVMGLRWKTANECWHEVATWNGSLFIDNFHDSQYMDTKRLARQGFVKAPYNCFGEEVN